MVKSRDIVNGRCKQYKIQPERNSETNTKSTMAEIQAIHYRRMVVPNEVDLKLINGKTRDAGRKSLMINFQ